MAINLDERNWPPGTVRIELLQSDKDIEVVLQPRPSTDPNDPLNWRSWEKHWNFGLVVTYTFMVFVFICSPTSTWEPMNIELGFSYEILNDAYAASNGTLAIGAFIMLPFALQYGRRFTYIWTTAAQLAATIWCAKVYTVADLMLTQAISCFVGSISEVLVQQTVADIYFVHQRGLANAWYLFAQNTGALLGPVAAGYISDDPRLGWRWVWWIIAMFWGVLLILFCLTYEETKYDRKETEHMACEATGSVETPAIEMSTKDSKMEVHANMSTLEQTTSPVSSLEDCSSETYLTAIHLDSRIPRKTYWQRLTLLTTTPGPIHKLFRHVYQPFHILFTIPAVFYMSIVYGIMCTWQIIMTVSVATYMVEPPWNFTASGIGLMNLAPFVGCTLGSMVTGPLSDWTILWLSKRNGGIYEPEMRLWVMVPFAPFLPIGAFIYGYGMAYRWSWPVIAVSYAIANVGTSPISSIAVTYITDSYTEIVGEALVGVTFTRNMLATVFVFALYPWIDAVGIANVFLTTGIIGIFILLFIGVFIWKGKEMRVRTTRRYRYFAERQFGARKV